MNSSIYNLNLKTNILDIWKITLNHPSNLLCKSRKTPNGEIVMGRTNEVDITLNESFRYLRCCAADGCRKKQPLQHDCSSFSSKHPQIHFDPLLCQPLVQNSGPSHNSEDTWITKTGTIKGKQAMVSLINVSTWCRSVLRQSLHFHRICLDQVKTRHQTTFLHL